MSSSHKLRCDARPSATIFSRRFSLKKFILSLAIALVSQTALSAQNIAGSWQGTLSPPQAPKPLQLVLKITRADDESLRSTFYNITQSGQPLPTGATTLKGSTLSVTMPSIGGTYEGKLSGDFNTITGTWSQGPGTLPLVLARATPETAWAIPDPPPPPKIMSATAKPTFEVSTIKPANPANPGKSILVGRGGLNTFSTTNTTLKDLITFAYGLHARQVSGDAAWVDTEKFDITAKPDQEGIPSVMQLRTMLQKLLTDRFQLTFHYDRKELPAYAITAVKTGIKMSPASGGGNLPGFGGQGRGAVLVQNATMAEFAEFLQGQILDRPVVDQTGLPTRYNFALKWTPDPAPPAPGAPPPPPPAADAPPDIFAAVQQQLGLKLESTKAPVNVMIIDKAEKPGDN